MEGMVAQPMVLPSEPAPQPPRPRKTSVKAVKPVTATAASALPTLSQPRPRETSVKAVKTVAATAASASPTPSQRRSSPPKCTPPPATPKFRLARPDRAQLRKVFDKFDADGSGLVSTAELSEMLTSLKVEKTPAEVEQIVKDSDPDGSGEIDFDEFVDAMEKNAGELSSVVSSAADIFGFLNPMSWFGSGQPMPASTGRTRAAADEDSIAAPSPSLAPPGSPPELMPAPPAELLDSAKREGEAEGYQEGEAFQERVEEEGEEEEEQGWLEEEEGDGIKEVVIERPTLHSVPRWGLIGFRLHSEKDLDKRRLWGLAELRLPQMVGDSQSVVWHPPQTSPTRALSPMNQMNPMSTTPTSPIGTSLPVHRPVVVWVNPDGPAYRAGLRVDDVILTINECISPSDIEAGDLMRKLEGTISIVVQPLMQMLELSTKKRLGMLPAPKKPHSPPDWGSMPDWDNSPRPGVPTTKRQNDSGKASPRELRSKVRRPAVVPPKIPSAGRPITPRGMKTSMQLVRELSEVRQTIDHMQKRMEQAYNVTRGTKLELLRSVESTKKTMNMNPSLSMSPNSGEAMRAAADEVREDKIVEEYVVKYGVEPTEDAYEAELKLAIGKLAKRRAEANRPVLDALSELEEVARLAADSLEVHEERLHLILTSTLPEHAQDLQAHYEARQRVVKTTNRFRADHLVDEATHECLRLAAEQENSARWALNEALKAARRERSAFEACKADLQRAAQEKQRVLAKFKQDDLRGTTFHSWNQMDLDVRRSRPVSRAA